MVLSRPEALPEGWLTVAEARVLQRLAQARTVLEIGAWQGRSTVVLAEVAMLVVSVDHHSGPPYDSEGSTLGRFLANLHRREIRNVVPIISPSTTALPLLMTRFDLAYIDGGHEFSNIVADGLAAWRIVRPGGVLAFHDYSEVRGHPGVNQGVDFLAERWGVTVRREAEALAIIDRKVI